jgi:hypothetical protein
VDPATLVDLELIKQLKARYCRLIDERDWVAWGQVFTEDCRVQYTSRVLEGREAVVAYSTKALAGSTSVHVSHLPEITVDSANHATGIWAMFDYVEGPGFRLHGFGRYYEEYAKGEDGTWQISALRLARARVDNLPPLT